MITTDDDDLAEKIRLLRFHGVNRDSGSHDRARARADYDVTLPGLKYNLTDLQASLGRVQLQRLEDFIGRRSEICAAYDRGLEGIDGNERAVRPGYPHR